MMFTSLRGLAALALCLQPALLPVVRAQTLDAFSIEPNGFLTSAAAFSEGDLLVGGMFSSISGSARARIAMLTADGSLASGFQGGITSGSQVLAIAVHPDRSVTIGGSFTQVGGQAHANIARYTPTGAVDHTFAVQADARVMAVALQSDGKLLIAGSFNTVAGQGRMRIARLNADGTVDAGFAPAFNDEVLSMLLQADGSIVVGGRFTQVNGTPRNRIARLTASGDLDPGFDPNADDIVTGIVRQADGRFLVLGAFGSLAGASRRHVVRFSEDGAVDGTFMPPANTTLASAAAQVDGKILLSGVFSDAAISGTAIIRVNADGTLDNGFEAIRSNSPAYIVLDGTGHMYAAGGFTSIMGEARRYLARVTIPGEPTRELTVGAGGDVTWTLGGGMPVPLYVRIETSADGASWTALGNATRSNEAWTLAGAAIPVGTKYVRAYGAVGTNGSDSSLVEGGAVLSTAVGGPVITDDPLSQTVNAGSPLVLQVTAMGAGTLTYQWYRDGQAIEGATSDTLSIASAQASDEGTYTVRVANDIASVESIGAQVVVAGGGSADARILNLSTRALVGTDANVMIPGFVIGGNGAKKLLIRAVGPTLAQSPFGLSGVLADPNIVLKRWNAATPPSGAFEDVATNDNWGTNANAAEVTTVGNRVGAFALADDHEAALLVDLNAGIYTVVTNGVAGGTGIAVVEVYDADEAATGATLLNMSNRGFAGMGDQVMIPGFVISGGPKTVLLRVVGPTLAADHGVTGTLADPQLALYRTESPTSQVLVTSQNNWGDDPEADRTAQVAAEVGAFPLVQGSADAALVTTLQPGIYTAIGSSAVPDATGVVLVEVYVVP